MSWQEYVDKSLIGSGNVDKAAIFSVAGDSKWAGSSDFEVSAPELQKIVGAFSDNSEPKQVQSEGFYCAGERYVVIKAEDRSLYGKKGRTGVIIVTTKQAILIAHYPENAQPGAAANTVEQLGDYLMSVGY